MGSFPDSVVRQAWVRSGQRCECDRTSHLWHSRGRCPQKLNWGDRGDDKKATGWETHHIVSQEKGGKDILSNCQILCIRCHKATRTYGG